MEKDPYDVLGVARDAGDEEIRRAYRNQVKQEHPDAGIGGNDERFRRLTNAYESIRTQDRRDVHAQMQTRVTPRVRTASRGAHGFTQQRQFRTDSFGVLDDLITTFLAGGIGWTQTDSYRSNDQSSSVFQTVVNLSRNAAAKGVTLQVRFPDRDRDVTVPPDTHHGTRLTYRERAANGRTTVLILTVFVSPF